MEEYFGNETVQSRGKGYETEEPKWVKTTYVCLQGRKSPGADVQDQQTSPGMQIIGFLKGDTNSTKEGSFSTALCSSTP